MSDPVWLALIAGAPGIITAIYAGFNRGTLKDIKKQGAQTQSTVNGRMDQMLSIQHEKSYAQGLDDGTKKAAEKC